MFTPTVLYNSLILWEMVLLSVFARKLYKRSVPETQVGSKNTHIPQHIHTINDKIPVSINNNSTDRF